MSSCISSSERPRFLSTPSARRATRCRRSRRRWKRYFYPRPPRGGRHGNLCIGRCGKIFLSTPSARRATRVADLLEIGLDISIHALREEGDPELITKQEDTDAISIHALREEGDLRPCAAPDLTLQFLSTPSARRATGFCFWMLEHRIQFLSTPSARRATASCSPTPSNTKNFYPRPPRGGRPTSEGGDAHGKRFLSTPSARRATRRRPDKQIPRRISIHALREEGDYNERLQKHDFSYFYPRPPRGGRLTSAVAVNPALQISIHALREEGDKIGEMLIPYDVISIHALREEGDIRRCSMDILLENFYPRPPRGGRRRGREHPR